MTTEAGKRLLDEWEATTEAADREWAIRAIEAEACHHDARWIEKFTAWCVAAERSRIRAAVEGMEPESLDPEFVSRAAVLRIIDGEDTDA